MQINHCFILSVHVFDAINAISFIPIQFSKWWFVIFRILQLRLTKFLGNFMRFLGFQDIQDPFISMKNAYLGMQNFPKILEKGQALPLTTYICVSLTFAGSNVMLIILFGPSQVAISFSNQRNPCRRGDQDRADFCHNLSSRKILVCEEEIISLRYIFKFIIFGISEKNPLPGILPVALISNSFNQICSHYKTRN